MTSEMKKQVQELMNATCGSKDIGIGNDSHGLNHKGNNFITSGMSFSLRSTLSPLGFKVVNGEGVPH